MNTPDTEWEERFNEVYPSVTVGYDGSEMDARRRAKVWQFIEDEITTLNARHHTALTSRDTYWKERVQKIYLKILKKARKTDYADTTEYDECAELLKPLLDNLK